MDPAGLRRALGTADLPVAASGTAATPTVARTAGPLGVLGAERAGDGTGGGGLVARGRPGAAPSQPAPGDVQHQTGVQRSSDGTAMSANPVGVGAAGRTIGLSVTPVVGAVEPCPVVGASGNEGHDLRRGDAAATAGTGVDVTAGDDDAVSFSPATAMSDDDEVVAWGRPDIVPRQSAPCVGACPIQGLDGGGLELGAAATTAKGRSVLSVAGVNGDGQQLPREGPPAGHT